MCILSLHLFKLFLLVMFRVGYVTVEDLGPYGTTV